jgi:hypothetical protein
VPGAKPIVICCALLSGVVLWGCDRKEPVAVYQAPKDTTPVITSAVGPAPSVEAPPRPASGELTWKTPPAWKEEPASSQMRFASYLVNENPKVEMTVVPLGPEAGDLLPNINRWERQLHLPPSPAEKLRSVAHPEVINGLEATLVDLTGPASSSPRERMLAAIVPHAGRVWFFKLSGPVDIVSAQKANFDSFMQSLKPGAAGSSPGAEVAQETSTNTPSNPSVAGGDAGASMPALPPSTSKLKLVKWTASPDWKPIPGATGPRAVAFDLGSADKKAEIIVTHFSEGQTGGLMMNINRWRSQIGLGPVQDPHSIQMKDTLIGDQPGMVLEFDNPNSAKQMVVAIGATGDGELWFYKLTGPSDTVKAQRPAFDAFLKSVQFAPSDDSK